MNVETISLIFSIAAVTAAVLSPVLVAIIDNIFKARRERQEFYTQHKCEVIENYLRLVGAHIYGGAHKRNTEYAKALAEIYMYVPEDLWKHIDEMNTVLEAIEQMPRGSEKEEDTHSAALFEAKAKYHEFCKLFTNLSRRKR